MVESLLNPIKRILLSVIGKSERLINVVVTLIFSPEAAAYSFGFASKYSPEQAIMRFSISFFFCIFQYSSSKLMSNL